MANELSLIKPIPERDDGAVHEWRREKQRLEDENRSLRRDLENVTTEKDRLARTVKNLQHTLNPFHRALGALFGEMDLAVGEETFDNAGESASRTASTDPRWEHYKQRFPGVPARIIDALLIQGDMQVTHLATMVKAAKATVYNAGDKLAAAGAITRDAGLWSLKR